MTLPMEEKMEFKQGDDGVFLHSFSKRLTFYRYRAAGANAVDTRGKPDIVESLNIATDDALAWPKQARRAYCECSDGIYHYSFFPPIFRSQ